MTMSDPVNHPPHYTTGRQFEVIEVLEDAVRRAPDPVLGALQWQVLKYLERMWDKDNPQQDAQKAMWYLMRLVDKLDVLP
jgi:hypothetical protein